MSLKPDLVLQGARDLLVERMFDQQADISPIANLIGDKNNIEFWLDEAVSDPAFWQDVAAAVAAVRGRWLRG